MTQISGQGTHVCGLYGSPEEQTSMAAQYLAEGLLARERCVYVAESRAAIRRVHDALAVMGIDAEAEIARGALLSLTQDTSYLSGGCFDLERIMAGVEGAIIAALDAGFAGLRGCGDMSWLLRGAPGSERVFEYEARITEFFRGRPVQALCLYDWRRMPPSSIRGALMTHPLSISR